jgi:hypothetical protein
MRKKPRIYLDRESVCLADDVSPHDEEWILRPEYDLLGLLNMCKKDFLPTNIQGENPGWEVILNDKAIAIIEQKWESPKIFNPELTLDMIKNENGEVTLFFKYLEGVDLDRNFVSTKNA